MANTFELIQSATVGSGGAADITFNTIPGTYTDLVIKGSFRTNRTASLAENILLQFNGSATSYSTRYIEGAGSGTPASGTGSTSSVISGYGDTDLNTANTFGNYEIYIPNYAGSAYKSISGDSVTENNATTAFAFLSAGLWSNTSAITSIKLYPQLGPNFMQYSTAYLYGVKNA